MIFVLGRKDLGTGILRNRTDGGEGASGCVQSEEKKKKCSVANSGENNPNYGKTLTEKTKKKISEANSGENHPSYGKTGILSHNYGKTGALNPRSNGVIAIQPDGTELHFGSGREAARELGIHQSSLSKRYLKTGHVLTQGPFKGWRFVYKNR